MSYFTDYTLKRTHTDLLYVDAVRALQVPQASLHQVGQEFVNGLMAYVFKVVITKQHRTECEHAEERSSMNDHLSICVFVLSNSKVVSLMGVFTCFMVACIPFSPV